MAEMKVLSHEADSLAGDLHTHVSSKKQKYTKLAREILGEMQAAAARESPRGSDRRNLRALRNDELDLQLV